MPTPPTNRASSRDPDIYDKIALPENEWGMKWGPDVPVHKAQQFPKAPQYSIDWAKNAKSRVQSTVQQSNGTVFKLTKKMTEIVGRWLSEKLDKKLKIV